MVILSQILFFGVLVSTVFVLVRRIKTIKSNILSGKNLLITGQRRRRWKNVILLAFGQKKMFRRWVPAIFHLFIYIGFIVINLEIIEFMLDGLTGRHRFFASLIYEYSNPPSDYNVVYNTFLNVFEFLCLSVIIACLVFLIRRNVLRMERFKGIEMTRWPVLDANLILIFEIILMLAILAMNGADLELQRNEVAGYVNTGPLYISNFLTVPMVRDVNLSTLIVFERAMWWIHILGILGFGVYVTYSKHLHIIMAFPNTYFANINPPGTLENMDEITKEVKSMLGIDQPGEDQAIDPGRFGVYDVCDLTWKNIMDAYTCTECGRCTSVCPAHITGKKLSPRKIIMDVRDRVENLGKSIDNPIEGSLFDLISREELFACTTCNACIDICPVSIDPVEVIIGMRRYAVLEESSAPTEWNQMFGNIETNFSPWKFPFSDRNKWIEEIKNTKKN